MRGFRRTYRVFYCRGSISAAQVAMLVFSCFRGTLNKFHSLFPLDILKVTYSTPKYAAGMSSHIVPVPVLTKPTVKYHFCRDKKVETVYNTKTCFGISSVYRRGRRSRDSKPPNSEVSKQFLEKYVTSAFVIADFENGLRGKCEVEIDGYVQIGEQIWRMRAFMEQSWPASQK